MSISDLAQYETRLIKEGSPYELQRTDIGGIPYLTYKHAAQSLNGLFRKATSMGDAPLAIFEEHRLSYRQAFNEAARLSSALRARFAVGPGTRIGIVLENRPEWVVAFLAIVSLGATAVLIDEHNPSIIQHSLNASGCVIAIVGRTSPTFVDKVDSTIALILVDPPMETERAGVYLLKDLLFDSSSIEMRVGALPDLPADSEAVIAFTSGTTGYPKGVILTHRGIVTGLMNMALGGLLAGVTAGTTSARTNKARLVPCALVMMPLSYIGGYAQLLLMLTLGGRLVLRSQWNCREVCQLIDSEQVRSLAGATPAQVLELIEARPEPGSLVSIGLNGSALHSAVLERIAAHWPHVVVGSGYGMTETNGSIAAIAGDALRKNPMCAGRVVPTVQIRIVGDDAADVPDGSVGEIWLRGANLMRGYCVSSSALPDGWFNSGDLGVLSEDRMLSVIDRAQHLIEVEGRPISAIALERTLVAEFGIAEAVVLHDSQEGAGQSILIVVVPASTPVDTDGIKRKVKTVLTGSSVAVVKVNTLPTNRSGKVDRAALRAEFVRQQAANHEA